MPSYGTKDAGVDVCVPEVVAKSTQEGRPVRGLKKKVVDVILEIPVNNAFERLRDDVGDPVIREAEHVAIDGVIQENVVPAPSFHSTPLEVIHEEHVDQRTLHAHAGLHGPYSDHEPTSPPPPMAMHGGSSTRGVDDGKSHNLAVPSGGSLAGISSSQGISQVSQNHAIHNQLLHSIPTIISEEDNHMLFATPNDEEIKLAVWNMKGDSAPGPDGFTGNSYTSCWDIIAKDGEQAASAPTDQFKEGVVDSTSDEEDEEFVDLAVGATDEGKGVAHEIPLLTRKPHRRLRQKKLKINMKLIIDRLDAHGQILYSI
ncbi:hypothetical protein Taro_032040 [Colocasia esculenta]|uniref:Uncharacterized protein n=1 Tax=Colocasia esculenta TaxID=4460 RepID=A0A843VTP5_COLES|nr:hypothetical protein [Colocasia esculenta]